MEVLTRRELLKTGLLGGAALMLPLERSAVSSLRNVNRLAESRLPKPFSVTLPAPPLAQPVHRTATTDFYELSLRKGWAEILPGMSTEVWGYEGIAPGPTIVAEKGREVVVRVANRLVDRRHPHSSLHLHGNASAPQYDGYANDILRPGWYKDYRYPMKQPARTMWYHDHGVHTTGRNAYMGCAALFVTHDAEEDALSLPEGRYDVPLVLRDAIFGEDGSLLFDEGNTDSLFGDVILVNGRPWPRMGVERRKYRFRFLNGGLSRSYRLALSTGEPMTVIGTDGGLMPAPQRAASLLLGMAERYEVVIDFAAYRVGQQVVLRNISPKNNPDQPTTNQIMRFDVVSEATDPSNNIVPDVLAPNNPVMQLQTSQATVTRSFRFERRNGMWTINGNVWDPARIDARPEYDAVEIWEFVNKSGGWFHPIHMHLVDFRILDRDGAEPRNYQRGPKDTVYLGEGATVRVLTHFDQRGKYMMHCHNIVHEDHDMMTQFEVGRGGPDPLTAAPPQPLAS
jgi:spore coat protein A, manganese oxidase